jgi:hypothetical protein
MRANLIWFAAALRQFQNRDRKEARIAVSALVVSLALLSHAQAANILFNNVSNLSVGNRALFTTGVSPEYQSFSTGAASIVLTDVKLALVGDSSSTGLFSLDLLLDNGGPAPGAGILNIGSLSDTLLPAGGGSNIFDVPISSFSLSPNTRYWIELSSLVSNSPHWSLGFPTGSDIGLNEFTDDDGTIGQDGAFPGNPGKVFAFQMEVSGDPAVAVVPEPSSFLFGATGLLALLGLLRWMMRSASSDLHVR